MLALPATSVVWIAGCGGESADPEVASPGLPLVSVSSLGLAYANSSINTSAFREQPIVLLADGMYAAAYFDAEGEVRLDLLGQDLKPVRSLRIGPRLDDKLLGDGHCSINLGLSSDGAVHVMYGAHGTFPFYARIARESLALGTDRLEIEATAWPRTISYPQFYRVGSELELWFRSDPDNSIERQRYSAADRLFPASSLVMLMPQGEIRPYMNQLAHDGERIALSWTYRLSTGDGQVHNEDLHVAVSDDAGQSWRTGLNQPVQTPIARGSNTLALRLSGTDKQPMNQTGSCFGPGGSLHVSLLAKDDAGVYQIQLVTLGQGGATMPLVEVVSDNRQRFELIGAGTLALPLSRPQVVASTTHLHMIYRQDGKIVVATRAHGSTERIWTFERHDLGELGFWEPSCCHDAWATRQTIAVYLQQVRQGPLDTEEIGVATLARVLRFGR